MSQPLRAYKFKQRTVSWEVQFADVRRIPQGARVFGESSSHWGVKEASAVALPSIGTETGDWSRHRCVLVRRSPFQSSMRAMLVEIGAEIEQFVFQIRRGPEQHAIQILASNRADQPFHKGMGEGNIGNGFDLGHLQYPQMGLPLPKPIKGIMVGAEVLGHPGLPSNGAVEHPAKCDTMDGTGMDAEPNDPAGILIHDDQDPVRPQRGRFAPEHVYPPEAVLEG